MRTIKLKRVYESPNSSDGYRALVDRLWPRGVSKVDAHIDGWWKDITPSPALRTWFGHRPERFAEFSRKYGAELKDHQPAIRTLLESVTSDQLTLVYAASDPVHNHVLILAEVLRKYL